jgi:phage/plasmid-associated DNA primase
MLVAANSLREKLMNPSRIMLAYEPPEFLDFCNEMVEEIERRGMKKAFDIYQADYRSDSRAKRIYRKIANAGDVPIEKSITTEERNYINDKLNRWKERLPQLDKEKICEEEEKIASDYNYFCEVAGELLGLIEERKGYEQGTLKHEWGLSLEILHDRLISPLSALP